MGSTIQVIRNEEAGRILRRQLLGGDDPVTKWEVRLVGSKGRLRRIPGAEVTMNRESSACSRSIPVNFEKEVKSSILDIANVELIVAVGLLGQHPVVWVILAQSRQVS